MKRILLALLIVLTLGGLASACPVQLQQQVAVQAYGVQAYAPQAFVAAVPVYQQAVFAPAYAPAVSIQAVGCRRGSCGAAVNVRGGRGRSVSKSKAISRGRR